MAGSNRLASHRGNIRANGRRRKARGGDRQTRLSVERLEQRTLLTANFLPGVPVWQAQGPAPITGVTYATPDTSVGAVESILPVPTGSVTYNVLGYSVTETVYTIYAGTVNGGVWEADNVTASTLNAINWRPLSDNEPSLGVASMAYDPRLKTLWVGTGSVSSAYRQGGPDVGLLKSTDSGTTWTQLGTGLAGQRIVTVLPTANYEGGQQVVFAASLDGGGILRSNDGGKNFNAVTKVSYLFGQPAGTLAGTATDIVQDPNNANRFYAALAGQGVFESDDDGLHWGWIDNGIPQMTQAEGTKLAAVYDGTTHQTNLYAVTEKGGNVTGAWITHPVGNYSLTNQPQWSAIGTVPESKPGDPTTAPQADVGYGHFAIAADPTNPNAIYLCGYVDDIYQIDVGTGIWSSLYSITISSSAPNPSQPHSDARALAFLNTSFGETLLVGNDGGINSLPNANPQALGPNDYWGAANGNLEDTEFFSISYDSTNGLIVGGTQDNGTAAQQTADGATWSRPDGGDGGTVAVDNSGSNSVYYTFSDNYADRSDVTGFAAGVPQYTNTGLTLAAPASPSVHDSGLNAFDKKTLDGIPATSISGASNAAQLVISSSSNPIALGLQNGDAVTISGVVGNTAANNTPANGIWAVSDITTTGFKLKDGKGNYVSGNGVYQSGGTWSVTGLLAQGNDGSYPIVVNTASPNSPQPILLGLQGIYESSNQGDTIRAVIPPPTGMTGSVQCITYASADGAAYFGTTTGQLFMRVNGQDGFEGVTSPAWGGAYAVQIIVDPADRYMVYVLDTNGKIWGAGDINAAVWTPLNGNLTVPGTRYTAGADTIALYDPTPNTPGDGVLLAAGLGGVYRMNLQLGAFTPQWSLYGQGLPNVLVTDLQYIPPNSNPAKAAYGDLLLAGTLGRGAWTISDARASLNVPAQAVGIAATNAAIVLRNDLFNATNAQLLVNNQLELEQPWSDLPVITIDTLDGSASNNLNSVDIQDVAANTGVLVFLGAGTNTVNINTTSEDFSTINGKVAVYTGSGGSDNFYLNDQGDKSGRTITLKNAASPPGFGFIGGLDSAGIFYQYSPTTTLTVETDAVAGNQINVLETAVKTTLIIDAPTSVSIGDSTVGAQSILGDLYLQSFESFFAFSTADEGNLSVTINDTANKNARTGTVTTFSPVLFYNNGSPVYDTDWGKISGLAPATINYEYLDTTSVIVDPGPADPPVVDHQDQGDRPPPIYYGQPPAVSGVYATSGKQGDTVTVFGYNLGGATAVNFGNTAATILSIIPPVVGGPVILRGIWDVQVRVPTGTGTVDVTVTTPSGPSATSSADLFNYVPPPTVSGVSPGAGPLMGPDVVDVSGTNLGGATAVDFGANPGTILRRYLSNELDPTSWVLVVSVPSGAAGKVDVTVTTPGGTSPTSASDKFIYAAGPQVYAVSAAPSGPPVHPAGPLGGGTTVYITGANLSTLTEVDFAGNPGMIVSHTDTQIVVKSPAGAAGAVAMVVDTLGGAANISAAFTYTAAPVLIPFNVAPFTGVAVYPNFGPYEGGTTVTINGANLTGATAVDFGSTPATSFIVNSDATITAVSPAQPLGSIVDVTVTTAGGTSALLYGDLFQYTHEPPYVYGVSPPSGDVAGGTTVTITGMNLLGATEVDFGSVLGGPKATSFTINSPTQITATTPAGLSVGTVDVTVLTPGERSAISAADHFTYTSSIVPIVSSLSPSFGPLAGGTSVGITGSHLSGATAVYFGATPAATFTVNPDGTIAATSPALAAGTVDVTVVTLMGTSATSSADQFTYQVPGPVVATVSPNSGPPAGGTSVTISGSNLSGATAVKFGGNLATNLKNNANGTITVTSPPGSSGPVDVTVVTAGGTSAVTPATDQFTYGAAPSISLMDYTIGPANQGGFENQQIFGANLLGATDVLYGPVDIPISAAGGVRDEGNGIDVIGFFAVPAEGPGTVDVRVLTPNGESPITAADQFTYTAAAHITSGVDYGPVSGGTTDTISGWNMQGATAVSFGSVPAQSFSVSSNGVFTTITAVTPAGAPGLVGVTVTTPQGTASIANGFRYFATPTISSITPATGPLAGGNTVLIAGTGLSGGLPNGYTVYFGGIPGVDAQLSYLYDTDTTLAITVPAGASLGTVDVTVVTPGGTSATSAADQYTYEPPPTVTVITSPASASGPLEGGTRVTITGTGLANATKVNFVPVNYQVSYPAAMIVSDSDSQIIVISPAAIYFGPVDVTVTTANGTSATSAPDQFTYTAAPFIYSMTAGGHVAGGDTVTIFGEHLDGATAVGFGPNNPATIVSDDGTYLTVKSPPRTAGTVDVTVTTPIGTSDRSEADQFTYFAVPSVSGIGPSSGSTLGGTQVTIIGSGLAGATQVKFDQVVATIVSDLDGQIIVTAPPLWSSYTPDVTVTTPGGTSATSPADVFTYMDPPSVDYVVPVLGSVYGGNLVTITGRALTGAQSVLFGANPGTIVSNTDSQIVVLSPEATGDAAGTVSVSVVTQYGTGTDLNDLFTYAPPPVVTGISRSIGPQAGGTAVVISGNGLFGATAVDFGSTPAVSFFVDSLGEIQAISPLGAASTVDVTVVTPGGKSATSSADQFTYVAAPTVLAINPMAGPIAGGTQVTITGTGLAGATRVDFNDGFGDDSVGAIVSDTSGQIVVTSPNFGFAGTFDVTVTTVGGTSATSPADQFTYAAAPTVSRIGPTFGFAAGGDLVTINGANLGNATAVDFGPNAATIFSETATQIEAISPAGAVGSVDVSVVTPIGTSATSSADQFLYIGAPTTGADHYTTAAGSTLTVPAPGVLANDSDPQGLPLTATLATNPAHGTLSFSSDGSFSYAPDNGYRGADSFIYQASNAYFSSGPTTVSLVIGTLTVTTTANGGPGSLRQAILDANGTPGTAATIQFELPAGPQTINLLTPLPAATDPLTLSLDATQNVTVALSSASAWNDNDALTVTGAGSLAFNGGIEGPGNLTVDAGSSLTANHVVQSALVIGGTAGSSATVTIAASDSAGNPLISASVASSSSSSVSALSNSVASNAGTEATLAARLAAIRARRLAQQLAAGPVSKEANDASSRVALTPVIVSTLVPTARAIPKDISTAAGVGPMIFVHAMVRVDENVKSAAISTVASGSLGAPVGESPMADTNVAISSVASQTGSSTVQDAAASRKRLDADSVAAAFASDNWEWLGSDPVAGPTYDSMDNVGGLVLGDDLLEAIGKKWGN